MEKPWKHLAGAQAGVGAKAPPSRPRAGGAQGAHRMAGGGTTVFRVFRVHRHPIPT